MSEIRTDAEMEGAESFNFKLFRDCFASPLIEKSAQQPPSKSKKARGNGKRKSTSTPPTSLPQESNDAEELAEFIDVGVTDLKHGHPETDYSSILHLNSSPAFQPAFEQIGRAHV